MARPVNPNPGTGVLGAILGGVLGGPWGAAAGGVVGAAAGGEKLPLEDALRTSLQAPPLRLSLVQVERWSKFSVRLLVRDASGRFWVLNAQIPVQPAMTPEQLEDGLYDAAMAVANEWQQQQQPAV